MSGIVQDLQKDALDRKVCVSDLLRKALVVAKKLQLGEFDKWISKELNGYLGEDKTPDYRMVTGEFKAWNPYLRAWVPVYCEDHEVGKIMSKRACGQSIAEMESLLEGKKDDALLLMSYPKKVELDILKSIDPLTEPRLHVQYSSLARILDTVRNIVLNWSLKLEGDGIHGEGLGFSAAEKDVAAKTTYTVNNFYGPIGQSQIQQHSTQPVQIAISAQVDPEKVKAFIKSMKGSIEALGLKAEQKGEAEAEIKTIESQLGSPKPKKPIIWESLGCLQRILEGAAGGAAGQLLTQIGELLK